jgi:hypothetical protein
LSISSLDDSHSTDLTTSSSSLTSSQNTQISNTTEEEKKDTRTVNAVWQLNFDELAFDQITDEVGSGVSAVVYKGIYRGQKVAIKILQNEPDFEQFEKELNILCSVRSPAVCYFYGACVSPNFILVNGNYYYLYTFLKDLTFFRKYRIYG